MKRTGLFTIILFLTAIIYSSCKEDVYVDWKLLNDKWYATFEDSMKLKDSLGNYVFQKTSSGIYYKVIKQGNQRHPNLSDPIYVNYRGSLVDGSVFDSTKTILYLSSTVKGWQEMVPKMQDGGNYTIYIPSKLGYDTATIRAAIPPYSVLRFDIHLINSGDFIHN